MVPPMPPSVPHPKVKGCGAMTSCPFHETDFLYESSVSWHGHAVPCLHFREITLAILRKTQKITKRMCRVHWQRLEMGALWPISTTHEIWHLMEYITSTEYSRSGSFGSVIVVVTANPQQDVAPNAVSVTCPNWKQWVPGVFSIALVIINEGCG